MKFETKSLGVFEILTLSQAENEVFDADQLRLSVSSLLEQDTRQIVIDISSLKYLYSDAINALVSINRRVLEQGGRMSILVTSNKLRDILLRAGLDSLFRIYRSETELSVETMEFLRQSSILARSPTEATPSSFAYDQATKAPRLPQEGTELRRQRRRSGARKESAPRRRPLGRGATSTESSPSTNSSEGATPQFGSAFPSDFSWDDCTQVTHGLTPPQPPPQQTPFFPPPPPSPQEE